MTKALPTMTRECKTHGHALHRQKLNGAKAIPGWKCVPCKNEYDKELVERKKRGDEIGQYTKPQPEKELKFCSTHHIALPATGLCDDC